MKTVLLVDDEESVLELNTLELEGKLDVQVIDVRCGNDAIAYLKQNPTVDIVICDYDMPNGNGALVYNYVKNWNHSNQTQAISFIFFTSRALNELKETLGFTNQERDGYLQKPLGFKLLTETTARLLNTKSNTGASEYCKVGLKRFLKFSISNFDLYIKLAEDKFVKVINKNNTYDPIQIEKYAEKGIDYLHISKEDFSEFSTQYSKALEASLKDHTLSTEDRVAKEVEGVQFIHETIQNLGINQTVVTTTNLLIESNQQMLKNNPDIFKLLTSMMANKNYIYEHSLMMSYFGSMIATEMKWSTSATLQKIVSACFMHDMLLENPEFAKIEQLTDDVIASNALTHRQVEAIKKHPTEMAAKVRTIKNFPPDIDQMIMDHHERPDGSGFPRGITSSHISPMTTLLIITEEFVAQIFQKKVNANTIHKVAAGIKAKYNHGNFKKTIEGFLSVIQKNKF
ncbi:MAG: response regulator [Oligoflexia bacterium]|nr:response regulator [Oligoflexia bacterium]MBF0367808.1 response regulator [Oligoflexia bacterium]